MARYVLSRRDLTFALLAMASVPARAAAAQDGVDVRTFGAVGDGMSDDTAALKRAHASGMPLIYPKTAGYFRTTQPLDVKADVTGRGGELRIHGNGKNQMELLRVGSAAPPLTISGMVLDGEYETGTAGEWSHAIALNSAQKVRITGNQIRRPYGDCVYVGVDDATKRPCADITIDNNTLVEPRRCCVAVISADRVRITGNHMVSHHNYVAAIDLEPNPNGVDRIHDVVIQDNDFDVTGTFMMLTKANRVPTSGVTVQKNRGHARVFLEVDKTAGPDDIVAGNQFTAVPASKGTFLLVYDADNLVVENNRDQTACAGGRYLSVRPKPLPGLVLKGNRFCTKT